ncbi:hypothetical protein R1sor_016752 [Riccia sorocarpa]|uniref:Uncharacterized protein n=1 Tax=Riccia sorocarpa TaxID=122646 RepID=A0ABD3HGD2_9MARC
MSDEEPADDKSKTKVSLKRPTPVQPSFSCTVSEFTPPGEDSEVVTCRIETSTHFSVHSRPAGDDRALKHRRLPSWIKKAEKEKPEKEQVEKESFGTSSDYSSPVNPYRLVDDNILPILRPSAGIGRGHMYVTRSLFRDSVPDMSDSSQSITVNPPAEIKTVSQYKLVGVFIDVLSPEDLVGCIPCDSEYLCLELLSEFGDDIMNLAKVKARLFTAVR